MEQKSILEGDPVTAQFVTEVRREEALLKAGALQKAIFNSANFTTSHAIPTAALATVFAPSATKSMSPPCWGPWTSSRPSELTTARHGCPFSRWQPSPPCDAIAMNEPTIHYD
jgi:hypothetical protein